MHVCSAKALSQVFPGMCHLYLGSPKHKLLPEEMRLISEEGAQFAPADVTCILDDDRTPQLRCSTPSSISQPSSSSSISSLTINFKGMQQMVSGTLDCDVVWV